MVLLEINKKFALNCLKEIAFHFDWSIWGGLRVRGRRSLGSLKELFTKLPKTYFEYGTKSRVMSDGGGGGKHKRIS